MKLTKPRRAAGITVARATTILLAVLLCLNSASATLGRQRLAIIRTKGIKPYESLTKQISGRLAGKFEIRTFAVTGLTNSREVEDNLRDFNPAAIIGIGNMSSRFCDSVDGSAMVVSSVVKTDADLCEKMVELINERLNRPDRPVRVVWPPSSILLNLRTIKKLNYRVPASLLNQARFVFGEK